MDLENFDIGAGDVSTPPAHSSRSLYLAKDALDEIDDVWYTLASRKARWMDLIGDYAGSEPFVIDGESLLQIVLDDPLLAIGRSDDVSFQNLHALQILERTLLEFTQRSANIEIVFWQANCHATIGTGGHLFNVASRAFARTLLFRHLSKLNIAVHTFESLDDPLWLRYEATAKPMFVMVNDGGMLQNTDSFEADRVLTQRTLLFDLLSRGIAVTLFKGAEFRDSKILSFVYEQTRLNHAQNMFPPNLWEGVASSRKSLDAELGRQSGLASFDLHFASGPAAEDDSAVLRLAQAYLNNAATIHRGSLYIFIMHSILIRKMSVYDRARPYESVPQNLFDILSKDFLPSLFFSAAATFSASNTSIDVDGRVFISLFLFSILHPTEDTASLIGTAIYATTQDIWSKLGLPPIDLKQFAALFPLPSPATSRESSEPEEEQFSLLPFDNEVFNAELALVHVSVDEHDVPLPLSSSHLNFGQETLFADTQHWHNRKAILPSHLGGATPKPPDERRRRRELRANQRFMATLQTQAATLTGASGTSLQQIVIPAVGSEKPKSKPASREPKTFAKKEKAVKLSSADKLRQKIKVEKDAGQEDTSQIWWKEQLKLISKMTNSEKITHVKLLYRNKKSEERWMGMEIRLYRLYLEFLSWIDEPEAESSAVRDRYTVSVMRMIKEISDRRVMSPKVSEILTAALQALGFAEYAAALLTPPSEASDKSLSFKFIKLIKSSSNSPIHKFMTITEHPTVWQLRLFGEYMDRSMDSAPDRRVAFDPDAWQGKVLDCIDDDHSLLVVAPTSAGKTFISFYAMEKVLRDSDDGILVYVAPTKALVTQIAAEVYARFSKNLNGKSCWAIHTRDYRVHDPQKCQILVTVPEMLAIMLLSPPLARVWTSRIKRIILDEIHSIGQQEGGAVWEQILLLAPCPVIGLSATIGTPDVFNNWLQSVQKAHGYKHTFIQHPHRYSHLRKFHYMLNIKPTSSFQSLETYQSTERARFLHPIAMLSFGARALPEDLALEAHDTLTLYQAMVSHHDSIDQETMKGLDPTTFFQSNSGLLKQRDIVRYEAALKAALSPLITSFDPQDKSASLYRVIHKLEDKEIAKAAPGALNSPPSRESFRRNLIYLVSDLHVKGELPAILFNFDRSDCEIMAQDLVSALQNAEKKWRLTNPAWKRKLREWENWKLHAKDRERLAEKAKKQKKDPDSAEPAGSQDTSSWESTFNPDDPSEQFSFAGGHTSYSKADLDKDVHDLGRWSHVQQWALNALKRGIAVHHAGMNKRYRSLVESLFRQGFVRVVIATGTLALGINAPTKTSVFCGDSPFLSALMYRQCAGRAGRRGYDLLGNVIFYGITMDRVQRLVLSKLPSLGGNFPLTATLALRLFNLLEGSDNAPVAKNAIQSILSLPHISFGAETGRHQLLHHLRFSIELLRRSRLLDMNGKPTNLYAIAAHLYYTEPSNLALVTLFQNGVIHKLATQDSLISAKRDFIILMAHLFGRRYLSQTYTSRQNIEKLTKIYPSVVVLPPLPAYARKALKEHQNEILRVFKGYARTYARNYAEKLGNDCVLPLSGVDYSGSTEDDDDEEEEGDEGPLFQQHLKDTAIQVQARSPFVANSGHGDEDFESVEELTRTTRSGLYLNEHAIPSFSHFFSHSTQTGARSKKPGDGKAGDWKNKGNSEWGHTLNAYLLDFYTHGQVSSLGMANGIRKGDVWYLLQDFTLTLMTVKTGLENLLIKASKEALSARGSAADLGDGEGEVDSGYGSFDPAEMDNEDGDVDSQDLDAFKRPGGVKDADWRVYEVVRGALAEFNEKFKAMWA